MHFGLRPVLDLVNSHQSIGYNIPASHVAEALVAVVFLGVLSIRRRATPDVVPIRWFAIWGGISLVLAVPAANTILANSTSDYMANRILQYAPLLIAAGTAFGCLLAAVERRLWQWGTAVMVAVILVAMLGRDRIAVHAYLLRTNDLDAHWLEHLNRLDGLELRGRLVLTDPYTAYYMRGMLGALAATVPEGVASPAVEYASRDKLALAALRGATLPGYLEEAVAVVVEKQAGLTEDFVGMSPTEIRRVWQRVGWVVAYEDSDVLALKRPELNP
jgi:hypothetical protein